jgi:hypothetical protein
MEIEVKEEPEEAKPHVSILDTRRESPVWLVRVPQWLAELWASKGADVELGKVEIKVLENDEKEARIFLNDKVELPCKSFKLKKAHVTNPKPMKIFSEDLIGNVAVEGVVKYKFDLEPEEKANFKRSIVRHAAELDVRNPKNKLPRIELINTVRQKDSKHLVNQLTGKRKRDDRGVPEKRERIDKDALLSMILDLFKDKEHLTFKEINERCQQPDKYLKEVLSGYCKYNKKGPNKGMYELKEEYNPNKKQKTETNGDDDDDDDD